MHKVLALLFVILLLPVSALGVLNKDEALNYCTEQVHRSLNAMKPLDLTLMPRNIPQNATGWQCRKAVKSEWCSGFWPGILWYAFEASHDSSLLKAAANYTESLRVLSEIPAFDHDLGFLMYCSYGNGYRLTKDSAYKKILLRTADTLATLFNPKVGTLLSWPREVKARNWPHNTIMDNMMNLELLFWAAKNGGSHRLYDIAVSHADKTMNCHFRPDFSSYHVAVYDTVDGRFIKGVTHQGYSDDSQWARGQAWAIYGFTMVYRETRNPKYLDFVRKVADYYLNRLPEDGVPFWDFDDPSIPDAPKDASAAAITASALLELSTYVKGDDRYRKMAMHMLETLSSPAYCAGKTNSAFLLHSTGNKPGNSEIDCPIVYADYYYIEALLRMKADF